jgi:peptidoglycan/LPS O-acetylase OafA/YrhL
MVDSFAVQIDDTHPSRLLGLDLLRAVAIMLVLFAHCPTPGAGEVPGLLAPLLGALKLGGWVGVDLFFVLSGFLVAGLLMREHQKHGSVRVGRFLVRRGWKIYPPLIVFVLFMVPLQRYTLGYWPTNRLISQTLFTQNYTPGIQTHLWSLAVEEHAYLLIALGFGLAAWFAKRRGTMMRVAWVPCAILALLVLVLIARLYTASIAPFSHYTHQFPTHLRIDGILSGVLLAYFYHYHRVSTAALLARVRPALLVFGLALILPPFLLRRSDSSFIYTWGLTTNYIAGLCLLAWTIGWKPHQNWLIRGLAGVGRHSYSIYIWHMTAYYLLLYVVTGQITAKPAWDGPYALQLVMFFAVSIVLGTILSVLIEVPTLRLRDRLSPSRCGTLTAMDGQDAAATKPVANDRRIPVPGA